MAALYNVYYPKKSSKPKKFAFSFSIVTIITVAEVTLENTPIILNIYNGAGIGVGLLCS
jgi:hypothetical protein